MLGKDAEHKSNQFSIVFSPPMAKGGRHRKQKGARTSGISFMAKKRTPVAPHVADAAATNVGTSTDLGAGTKTEVTKRPATAGPIGMSRKVSPLEVQGLHEPDVVVVMMRQV